MKEASKALEFDEVPVGAVVVFENRIIGRGYNQTESLHDATAHAEMVALKYAGPALGHTDLTGATLYSTGEPCIMCAGAIVSAGITTVVLGGNYSRYHGQFGDYSVDKALGLVRVSRHWSTC